MGPILDTTIFNYDSLFLRQVRDAKGQTYQFGHNALGWLVSRTDPTGKQDQYQYDQNGNLRQWMNRRNQIIVWDAYDALNRATVVTAAEGKKTRFAYDLQDRFAVDSNAASIDTVKVDSAGRPTGQISVRGTRYELRSTFTVRDLRDTLQILSPWSATVRYHYNANMVLDTLTDIAGGRTAFSYNSDLQPTGATLPTGLVITRDYPSTHTPQQVTFSDPTINSAIGVRYSYNSLGKVAERNYAAANGGRDFMYDALKRLSYCGDYTWQLTGCDWYCDPHNGCQYQCTGQGKVYSRTQTFSYDSVGNRLDLGAVTAPGNRLVKFNGDSLVYDDDGNFIKRIRGGQEIQRLWWNSLGQLVAVWTSGQDSVTFAYDGFGRRVSKQKASGTTRYVYDGDELFAEVDSATGNRLAEYTYYPWVDNPHSVRVGGPTGSVYYYAQDFPGNVVGLINTSNALANQYKYDPFGADAPGYPTGTVSNSLKFAARQQDSETGLYYMRARYYDPQVGRFISEDPIGLDGGINPYLYGGSDPVNSTDPSGTCQRPGGGQGVAICIETFIKSWFLGGGDRRSFSARGGTYRSTQSFAVNSYGVTWLAEGFGKTWGFLQGVGHFSWSLSPEGSGGWVLTATGYARSLAMPVGGIDYTFRILITEDGKVHVIYARIEGFPSYEVWAFDEDGHAYLVFSFSEEWGGWRAVDLAGEADWTVIDDMRPKPLY